MREQKNPQHEQKLIKPASGTAMLIFLILLFIAEILGMIYGAMKLPETLGVTLFVCSLVALIATSVLLNGFKIVNPNEAIVLVLFGKYYGTIIKDGFFYVNPFCVGVNPTEKSGFISTTPGNFSYSGSNKKISLKAMTLANEKQKVNDSEGNPIEIGANVIWRIANPTKAVLDVDNFKTYISTQCDSAIRNVARLYPYDVSAEGDEKSLRGSSNEIAEVIKQELQKRADIAGIEILDARIAHLAYATEIAAAMLQRQQAAAVIEARQKIVEGAVGMVEMALNRLNERDIVELDEERKAQMVSNLLVVLCSNKDTQPVVNSGSIY